VLHGEVFAVCSENHTKPINILYGQNVGILVVSHKMAISVNNSRQYQTLFCLQFSFTARLIRCCIYTVHPRNKRNLDVPEEGKKIRS
jgi:hypothetical protein